MFRFPIKELGRVADAQTQENHGSFSTSIFPATNAIKSTFIAGIGFYYPQVVVITQTGISGETPQVRSCDGSCAIIDALNMEEKYLVKITFQLNQHKISEGPHHTRQSGARSRLSRQMSRESSITELTHEVEVKAFELWWGKKMATSPGFHATKCADCLRRQTIKGRLVSLWLVSCVSSVSRGQLIHNKVISDFQVLRQARVPLVGLEPTTERSLRISGRIRYPLCHRRPTDIVKRKR
ncbi:hypothetical protein PoB_007525200 [Plakobranchus ocellatus]|uniref:Uncharacterized protein n=1 Tax=Plakobranchus ocellatus TaxID=259542 RepID=A0AAV4DWT0_9GAST|nr:hypothetical protein PoB_007525200 [Plakobranchus ocellatus]